MRKTRHCLPVEVVQGIDDMIYNDCIDGNWLTFTINNCALSDVVQSDVIVARDEPRETEGLTPSRLQKESGGQ